MREESSDRPTQKKHRGARETADGLESQMSFDSAPNWQLMGELVQKACDRERKRIKKAKPDPSVAKRVCHAHLCFFMLWLDPSICLWCVCVCTANVFVGRVPGLGGRLQQV